MNAVRYGMPIFLMLISIFFFINTFSIETASLSNPSEPLYFPLFTSVGLFILSIAYLVQEMRKQLVDSEDLKRLVQKKSVKIIGTIIVLCLIYSFLFETIGFLFSTILFLGALMFYLNGPKRWVLNVSVALLSSFTFWYLFNIALKVNLP
ncbi:tripartite tricarboxylate transporter TctB family protein [Alkalihalobacillus deserti]|uniref:tripartite tricarboxylate transporter TctB family protein n=1 Tax=Alkalihalobacillus deserti TaxID=2879466 RepID=UPI001D14CECA|nr:tripartite tricarboxylate transporter TctB family protein [Alkalihalobacillus deserti]